MKIRKVLFKNQSIVFLLLVFWICIIIFGCCEKWPVTQIKRCCFSKTAGCLYVSNQSARPHNTHGSSARLQSPRPGTGSKKHSRNLTSSGSPAVQSGTKGGETLPKSVGNCGNSLSVVKAHFLTPEGLDVMMHACGCLTVTVKKQEPQS